MNKIITPPKTSKNGKIEPEIIEKFIIKVIKNTYRRYNYHLQFHSHLKTENFLKLTINEKTHLSHRFRSISLFFLCFNLPFVNFSLFLTISLKQILKKSKIGSKKVHN